MFCCCKPKVKTNKIFIPRKQNAIVQTEELPFSSFFRNVTVTSDYIDNYLYMDATMGFTEPAELFEYFKYLEYVSDKKYLKLHQKIMNFYGKENRFNLVERDISEVDWGRCSRCFNTDITYKNISIGDFFVLTLLKPTTKFRFDFSNQPSETSLGRMLTNLACISLSGEELEARFKKQHRGFVGSGFIIMLLLGKSTTGKQRINFITNNRKTILVADVVSLIYEFYCPYIIPLSYLENYAIRIKARVREEIKVKNTTPRTRYNAEFFSPREHTIPMRSINASTQTYHGN